MLIYIGDYLELINSKNSGYNASLNYYLSFIHYIQLNLHHANDKYLLLNKLHEYYFHFINKFIKFPNMWKNN